MSELNTENFTESDFTDTTFKPGDLVQLTRERSTYSAITHVNNPADTKFFSISPNDVCLILSSGFTNHITPSSQATKAQKKLFTKHICLVRGQVVQTAQGIFELIQFAPNQ